MRYKNKNVLASAMNLKKGDKAVKKSSAQTIEFQSFDQISKTIKHEGGFCLRECE